MRVVRFCFSVFFFFLCFSKIYDGVHQVMVLICKPAIDFSLCSFCCSSLARERYLYTYIYIERDNEKHLRIACCYAQVLA